MTDRLTQLQDAVNQQADNFCNGMGILQQVSPAAKFPPDRSGNAAQASSNQSQDQTNYTLLFATLITRTAKDIDHLIESLPSEESSTELQAPKIFALTMSKRQAWVSVSQNNELEALASLRRLEQENVEATSTLKEVIARGERLLERVQGALIDISKTQMEMEKLDTSPERNCS